MRKSEDFSEWYNETIDNAGLSDKRYPIKGMNVWTPYGWALMRHIDEYIRKEMRATNHQEVCFPLLIPESEFKKESRHIKGFEGEVFWVTHAGLNPLDVKMLLRPTSETAMYPMFSLWIRSHADLPLKTYQIVNVFRYETKVTRTFIRVREVHFFEGHTCHATFEDAESQIREDMQIMDNLARHLAIPYLLTKRPDWDKFAGAYYSLGVDNYVAEAGKTLQIGTIHQYKDNFAKAYDVKFERNISQDDLDTYLTDLLGRLGYGDIKIVNSTPEEGRTHSEIRTKKGGTDFAIVIMRRIRDMEEGKAVEQTLDKIKEHSPSTHQILVCYALPVEMREHLSGKGVEVWDSDKLAEQGSVAGIEPLQIHQYVHQTTYGMSERMIGAIVAIHGDDRGVVLPPDVAPIQVIIVPILEKGLQEKIGEETRKLRDELSKDCRVHLDERDLRPGSKFYEWEAKGVPLRLELGPRDLLQEVVTIVRRDTLERSIVARSGIVALVRKHLDMIQGDLWKRAEKQLRDSIVDAKSFEGFKDTLNRASWCGSEECGHEVENRTGMSIIGSPFPPEEFDGNCVTCGKPTKQTIYVAKAF